jgi:SulP family sulfate permease
MEDRIYARVTGDHDLRHVILMFSAVNEVDMSALETLEAINARLKDMGVTLHLSEVKGPVMDRLARSSFPADLTGLIFLSQFEAYHHLRAQKAESPPAA